MKRKNEDDTEVPIKKQKSLSDVSNLVASLIERLKEEQNVTSGIDSMILKILYQRSRFFYQY